MMMHLRAGTDLENGALVLIGDEDAFRRLSRLLREHRPAAFELDPVVGRPLLSPLARLRVEPTAHRVTIRVSGEIATLAGNAASFNRLAEEFELFLDYNDLTEPGMHTHVNAIGVPDVAPDLDSESLDLILAGPVPDESS